MHTLIDLRMLEHVIRGLISFYLSFLKINFSFLTCMHALIDLRMPEHVIYWFT